MATTSPPPYFLLLWILSTSVNLAVTNAYDDENYNILKIRSHDELVSMHESWMMEHGKTYNALGEKEKGFEIFKDNLRYIEEHNAVPGHSYRLGLTPFADLTNDEFKKKLSCVRPDPEILWVKSDQLYEPKVADSLPDSIDWREKGAVGLIKNQGLHGSSWAFSAIASVEGIHQIVSGDLFDLSEQAVMDCSISYGNKGCDGGYMDKAFNYIVEAGGVPKLDKYPYAAWKGICKTVDKIVTIGGYGRVPADNETALMKAVANQPVSAWMTVGGIELQLYKSGIFNGWCGMEL